MNINMLYFCSDRLDLHYLKVDDYLFRINKEKPEYLPLITI